MKKYIHPTLYLVVVVLLLIVGMTVIAKSYKTPKVSIILYQNGRGVIINSKSNYLPELQEQIEEFLSSCNNALYELVTQETITKIKNGKAVEMIYPDPVSFSIHIPADSRKVIKVDRILIPLEGYYAPTVVFWGYKGYSSGPYINEDGRGRVEKIRAIIDTSLH